MKNIGELGEKLIDIHKKKKDAYEHEIDNGVNIENMNAVFIGSLADLQKQLGDKRNAHHSVHAVAGRRGGNGRHKGGLRAPVSCRPPDGVEKNLR